MNMSGPKGTVAQIAPLGIARKIFIHINNSNPVLRDDSPERAAVEAAGWEVSYDGMEVKALAGLSLAGAPGAHIAEGHDIVLLLRRPTGLSAPTAAVGQ